MLLVIDIGNTNTSLGVFEKDELVHTFALSSDIKKTDDEYGINLLAILNHKNITSKIKGAIISSVVPAVTNTLQAAVRLLCRKEAMVLGGGIETGLNIRIDKPEQLGADLAVGAVAALALCPPPLIVIDIGTATTITVIDKEGAFRGGTISPGPVISMKALAVSTAQLPEISVDVPKHCIGTDTISCMHSGAIYGAAAMLDGLIERMETELGYSATLIATGGLAACVLPHCHREIHYEPDLLLNGLKVIWDKNKK